METSGLDLGGPGARFGRVQGRFFRDVWSFLARFLEEVPPVLPPALPPAIPPTLAAPILRKRSRICRDRAEALDACLELLAFHLLAASRRDLREGWGGGDPPPGGFQSAAPPKVVRSVLNRKSNWPDLEPPFSFPSRRGGTTAA